MHLSDRWGAESSPASPDAWDAITARHAADLVSHAKTNNLLAILSLLVGGLLVFNHYHGRSSK